MNLTTELTRIEHLQGTGHVISRFRWNLERGFTLRTEAGVHPSAVGQPDDLDHLVRRVGEREEDFVYRFGLNVMQFDLFGVEGANERKQGIVIEPAPEGEEDEAQGEEQADHVAALLRR